MQGGFAQVNPGSNGAAYSPLSEEVLKPQKSAQKANKTLASSVISLHSAPPSEAPDFGLVKTGF
jgi:hypothetical protein